MSRTWKTIFWVFGAILICQGIWCLYLSIKFGLMGLQLERMPIDMRMGFFVSFCVSMAFFLFLCINGILSIHQGKMLDKFGRKVGFHPTFPNLAILFVLIALSTLSLSRYTATSMITWEKSRGVPLAFLTVIETRGPCLANVFFWMCRYVENIDYIPLIVNLLSMYCAICLSGQGLKKYIERR